MSTADQIEGYLGSGASVTKAAKAARKVAQWTGKHRAEARAMLTFRRSFYSSKHRKP